MAQNWKVEKQHAKDLITKIVNETPKLVDFSFNRISIRNQKTRWGSCSSKKNLNFNYKITLLPFELAQYLVVHEFCHLKELNHSNDYWKLVESILPNYKELHQKLYKLNLKKL